jgi:hypothetical protein
MEYIILGGLILKKGGMISNKELRNATAISFAYKKQKGSILNYHI